MPWHISDLILCKSLSKLAWVFLLLPSESSFCASNLFLMLNAYIIICNLKELALLLPFYRYKIFGKALARVQNDSQVCGH